LEDVTGTGKIWFRPVAAGCENPTDQQVEAALKSGPYGRCVFQCDNDAVDHQVVNMEFEGGVTAAFSMCSFTPDINRTIKLMGTKGQIKANMHKNDIVVTSFLTRKERKINTEIPGGHFAHGGGDEGIMEAFCGYVGGGYTGGGLSEIRVSAENHMIAFAAEESRINGGRVVELHAR